MKSGIEETKQLENIRQEIFREAESAVQETLSKAAKSVKEYEEKIISEIEKEAESKFKQFEKETRNRASQLIAQTQMECRNKRLQKENELFEQIITAARNKLNLLRDDPNYSEIIKLLIIEAVNKINDDELEILIDARDEKLVTQDYLSSIEIIFTFSYNRVIKLNLSDKRITTTGGIIIKTTQKNLYINNTFEERFKLIENSIRQEIAKTIFE